jgi:hypothetical protein
MVHNNLEWWTSLFVTKEHEAKEEWKGGHYYERLLKLTNSLQHRIINNFLTPIFRSRLQPYLCVTTIGMKRETLQ